MKQLALFAKHRCVSAARGGQLPQWKSNGLSVGDEIASVSVLAHNSGGWILDFPVEAGKPGKVMEMSQEIHEFSWKTYEKT